MSLQFQTPFPFVTMIVIPDRHMLGDHGAFAYFNMVGAEYDCAATYLAILSNNQNSACCLDLGIFKHDGSSAQYDPTAIKRADCYASAKLDRPVTGHCGVGKEQVGPNSRTANVQAQDPQRRKYAPD